MKKIYIVLVALSVTSIALVLAMQASTAVSQKNITQSGTSIPDDVAKILQKSCVSCHDAGGSGMARSIWSFSEWDNYSVKKQANKANAMCNAITKGTMPPSSIKNSDPEKMPNAEQKEIVCKWANSLNEK